MAHKLSKTWNYFIFFIFFSLQKYFWGIISIPMTKNAPIYKAILPNFKRNENKVVLENKK